MRVSVFPVFPFREFDATYVSLFRDRYTRFRFSFRQRVPLLPLSVLKPYGVRFTYFYTYKRRPFSILYFETRVHIIVHSQND